MGNQQEMQEKKKRTFRFDWLLLKLTEPLCEYIKDEEDKQFTMNMDSYRD